MDAGGAAGCFDQPGLATFRAERLEQRFGGNSCTADMMPCDRRDGYCQEPGVDHVALEDLADRGNQRRHITAVSPLAATRIEDLLQLVCYKRHIPAAPQDGADHAGERQDPRIVLQVLRVDEDLERSPFAVCLDIVDGDVEGVLAIRPAQLVGGAGELLRADKEVRRGIGRLRRALASLRPASPRAPPQ